MAEKAPTSLPLDGPASPQLRVLPPDASPTECGVPSGSSRPAACGEPERPDRSATDRKTMLLVANFTEDQLSRYEAYRRSSFSRTAVRKLIQSETRSPSVSPNFLIAMSGIAKVFVGEITEAAVQVRDEWSDTGALQPRHIREAVRRLEQTKTFNQTRTRKRQYLPSI